MSAVRSLAYTQINWYYGAFTLRVQHRSTQALWFNMLSNILVSECCSWLGFRYASHIVTPKGAERYAKAQPYRTPPWTPGDASHMDSAFRNPQPATCDPPALCQQDIAATVWLDVHWVRTVAWWTRTAGFPSDQSLHTPLARTHRRSIVKLRQQV